MLKAKYYTEPSEIDKIVFEKLVGAQHYLRQVKGAIDFEQLREIMKDCYSPKMGRGAEDPVMMLKLEFLQFHYNLSDREVIAEAGVNVAYRYFLDLSLESQLPVASLLSQFRSRLGTKRHEEIFQAIITQARKAGLVKDRLRLKDATHVVANVAIPFTIQLVAAAREKLLKSAAKYAPLEVEQHRAKANEIRTVTADLKDQERLLHRVQQLREIVQWAETLPTGESTEFDEALAVAKKILTDRENGQADKTRSLVDKDVRQGKHGSYYDGYKLDILVDAESELITAIEILPANANEAANAEKLIESEEKAQGNDIAELSMDSIGFNGEVLHTLANQFSIEVYVPPFEKPSNGDYFKPKDFLLDQSQQILTCPAGQHTSRTSIGHRGNSTIFHFRYRQCASCPLLKQCMPKLGKSSGRKVDKNYYQADYDAARRRAKTDRYIEVKKQHPRVERKFADIVCNHDGRRARFRGINKLKIQFLLIAMAVNIKRMVRLFATTSDLLSGLFLNLLRCPNFLLVSELTF